MKKEKTKGLSIMEEMLKGNNSPKSIEKITKEDVTEMTQEFSLKETGIKYNKKERKVPINFRCKKSFADTVDSFLLQCKKENPDITKTDIINYLLLLGINQL